MMKSPESSGRGVRGSMPLLILNGVLLTAVVTLAFASRAGARTAQPERARGAYTMVSGQIQGGNTDMMYIIDTVNQELVAVTWDINKADLQVIGYRNLAVDVKQSGSR